MGNRDTALGGFIQKCGWQRATRSLVAGDASNRKYYRLTKAGGDTAIVMDAAPQLGEDVTAFVRVAQYLAGLGFSAPIVFAEDNHHGFLLIEDLGDDLFARVLEQDAAQESRLYCAAIDVLLELHQHMPPSFLEPYSIPVMANMAALASDWYLVGAGGDGANIRDMLHRAMTQALGRLDSLDTVLIQRDFHAENLLWLPGRSGTARVGLLDFQDAMRGHPAYDLVSLLEDARRDVSPDTQSAMIERYVAGADCDHTSFLTAYHCLGAQRNLRILGVFARLCLRDGKAHYVDLIPRVWGHLMRDLRHPALGDLAEIVHSALPRPDGLVLERLRQACKTVPSQ